MEKFETKASRSFKLKCGIIIPKGERLTIEPHPASPDQIALCKAKNRDPFRIAYKHLSSLTTDIEEPDMQEIEDGVFDGECYSVTGQSVEPDGHDEYGFPSWLLVLGIC